MAANTYNRFRHILPMRLVLVLLGCCVLFPWVSIGQEQSTSSPVKLPREKNKRIIGATATIFESKSQLKFRARVDTGATVCSIHVVKMEVKDPAEKNMDNIGKMLRFKVDNRKDAAWIEGKIEDYSLVKNAEHEEHRYKVLLTLRWQDMEKDVLVTLNDRGRMKYPLLLGRNFLRGDLLVDVEFDNGD